MRLVKNLLLLLPFVGAYFLIINRHYIQLFFSSTPSLVADHLEASPTETVIVISPDSVCNICPAGSYLFSTREENALYILPQGASEAEIDNFVFTYEVAGSVIVSDDAFEKHMALLSRCSGLERKKSHVFRVTGKNSKLRFLKSF